MAEVLGVVSAGIGIAAFALQVAGSIETLHEMFGPQPHEIKQDLDSITDLLRILHVELQQLSMFDGQPPVNVIVSSAYKQYCHTKLLLDKLLIKLPQGASPSQRSWKRFKPVRWSEVRQQIKEVKDRIYEVISLLQLFHIKEVRANVERPIPLDPQATDGCETIAEESCPSPCTISTEAESASTNDQPRPESPAVPPTRRESHRTCTWRHCICSYHQTRKISGRFWTLEYTPLSILLSEYLRRRCDFTRIRLGWRLALSKYGIPMAMIAGLEIVSSRSGFSIRPSLRTERVVPYTSPAFKMIDRLHYHEVSIWEVIDRLKSLNRSDPTFKYHRDPSGKSYIHKILHSGWGLFDAWQVSLLELFTYEFGFTLEEETEELLPGCVRNIFNSTLWQELLDVILDCGYDLIAIDSPRFETWPDWYSWLQKHPDPFFLGFLAKLVDKNQYFSGSTPLHSAILRGSVDSVKFWLNRSRPLEENTNFLGQTPLHLAVRSLSLCQLILEEGHDMDVSDKWGMTPLMYAASLGQSDVATLLISRGANIHASYYGKLCGNFLQLAFYFEHTELALKTLDAIKYKYGVDVFHRLIRTAITKSTHLLNMPKAVFSPEIAKLVDDVNFLLEDSYRRVKNNTLMHYVKSVDEARTLIQCGFYSFNQENSEGDCAIRYLSRTCDADVVKFCLDNGADVKNCRKCRQSLMIDLFSSLKLFSSQDSSDKFELVRTCIRSGVDLFAADDCKCPCSPGGCHIASAFRLSNSENCVTIDPIWAFEWLTLVEEYSGMQAAKTMLLSFLRRAKCDEEDVSISHICCHRGRGIPDWVKEPSISDEDAGELLDEESEFVQLIEGDMQQLSTDTLAVLKTRFVQIVIGLYPKPAKREDTFVQDKNPPTKDDDEFELYYDDPPDESIAYSIGGYLSWLQYEYQRMATSPDRDEWFDRRGTWLGELMYAANVTEDDLPR